jgi:branched-chain amino acid transport system substrate-binding protein
MNSCRIFTKIFILFTVFFLLCGEKEATSFESTIPVPPKAKAEKKMQPPEIRQKEKKPPVFQVPSGLPDRNSIGCVLPLSGKYANYGSKALDAILFAAGIFDEKNKTPWKIVAEDSRGLPGGVKTAVTHLAKTENVIAIIAVTGTLEALDAAREAANQKVPLIMITAKERITSGNVYVFQHFLTPSQQVKALVKYALDDLNCATFSILYPKDNYGAEMTKIFRAEVALLGGKVECAIPFSKKQTDFTDEINKVIMNGVNTAKNANNDNPETKVQASIDFEALFIPDSYQRVKMIASQLAFYDVKGFTLLGTSLWNSPNLLRKDAECLEGAVFADSFFVNGFSPETNDFVDIYYTAYSREPENIEALSYDTMGIIISVLEDKNISTRKQFMAGLLQVKNYKGATGNTSFSEDRVSRKTAFILQVKAGKLQQVK